MAVLHRPSEKQLEVILSQIGETDEVFEENMRLLKNWIDTEPNIPKDYDERLLPLFLRGCKHNVVRTQNKLDKFYTSRATCDALFSNWDPHDSGTVSAMNFMECAPLSHLTDEGYRVVIHRIKDQEEASLRDVIRMLLMLVDLRMEQESAIAGDIYVFDVKQVKASFLVKLVTPLLKKTLDIIQNAYPQRLKQIHIVNAPSFVYNTVNLFKTLMTKKMKDRFFIHTTQETLVDYIPRRILPSDYLGYSAGLTELSRSWMVKLHGAKKDLQERTKPAECKSDMKSGAKNDIYGVDGIFKSLVID